MSSTAGDDDGLEGIEDSGSEEDKGEYGLHQALPVDDTPPDFFSGPPTTPEEYLRRVRHEARQLPDIMTSHVVPDAYNDRRTRVRLPVKPALPDAPEFAQPKREWISQFLRDFAELQGALQCDDMDCDPRGIESLLAHTNLGTAHDSTLTAALLRSLDQVSTARFLCQRISKVQGSSLLQEQDAMWLYGLLARLEKPVDASVSASMQALYRHLVHLRAKAPDRLAQELPWLNILIVIVGACFGQDEHLAPLYGA